MSTLTKIPKRKQTAVYWPLKGDESGQTDYDANGRPQWGTPYEIKCRWEDVSTEIILDDGTQTLARSMIYPDRDLRIGGVLLLSSLTASVNQSSPKKNAGAWEIIRVENLPDFKAKRYLKTVYL